MKGDGDEDEDTPQEQLALEWSEMAKENALLKKVRLLTVVICPMIQV